MILIDKNPWFVKYNQTNKSAALRLFCFHYGGGSASFFCDWKNIMPEDVEVVAIQLPGRENRFSEQPIDKLEMVVRQLSKAIIPYLNIPYVIFGHSIGALIGFELVRSIRQLSLPLPNSIIVSAAAAPQIPLTRGFISKLPDKEFIERLKIYNGIPEDFANNENAISVFMPLLRADLTLLETYIYRHQKPLDCSIVAIGGLEDPMILARDLSGWYSQAKRSFRMNLFEGGHFFIKEQKNDVLLYISNLLKVELSDSRSLNNIY